MPDSERTSHEGVARQELRRPFSHAENGDSETALASADARSPDTRQQTGTVVLIHGFVGHSVLTWPMARSLRRDGFEALTIGYDSWGRSLAEIRDRLAPGLSALANSSNGPLHLVGHSMGGLVIRALIARERPANLGRVVMIGTPNKGSEVADFVDRMPIFKPLLGRAGPALVTRRAASIDALLGPPVDYPVGVIAGSRKAPPLGLARLIPGPNDGKVSVASTRLPEAEDHIVLPLSHATLLYHPMAHRQVRHFLLHGHFAR